MTVNLQKGQHIDSITFVIDFDKFSPQRQFYWPGIQMIRKVGLHGSKD